MPSANVVGAGTSGQRVGFHFRPRIVVKFRDWVEAPYQDGAEKVIAEKYGKADWANFEKVPGKISLVRLYTAAPPAELRDLVNKGRQVDRSYKPGNFFSWYTIDTPEGLRSQQFAEMVSRWEIVETAYPGGINARFAWTIPGGDGAGQNVVDMEGGWTLNHEDLVAHGGSLLFGSILDSSRHHGTAVLGEICATDNTVGCVGIAPHIASLHVSSHSGSFSNVSDAILAVLGTLTFGDVLLLEMQTVSPPAPLRSASRTDRRHLRDHSARECAWHHRGRGRRQRNAESRHRDQRRGASGAQYGERGLS